MHRFKLTAAVLLSGVMAAGTANALTVTETNDFTVLTNALLAPGSGITLNMPGSSLLSGTVQQQGTYTGFNLAPSSGPTPTLTLGDGVVLTSGKAQTPLTNTTNNYSNFAGSGSFAPLTALAGSSLDSNVLSYKFALNPGLNSVQLQFVFATDEFPTQSVTDIFGFFVDGVNYAKFPGGELISNTPGNPTNFILNPVGSGLYGIEYNGLTDVFTVTGLIDDTLTEHTLEIAIADTSDTIFDSGVYVAGLKGFFTEGAGGIGDPTAVPEPATLALLGMGLLGLGLARRRKI